jgi:uncharacterized protein YecE (DUF72 family)
MAIWVGTSGYNYPEWKGTFYPETLSAAKMLPYYAERFPTVEINYTFYRTPNASILQGWNDATPGHFKLTLKAPKRITHDARLKDCAESVRRFCETAVTLGPKLGVLLFQLPPFLKKDLERLDAFLKDFPAGVRAAFEFRHASWFDDEVFEVLRNHQTALCIADAEGDLKVPFVATANWGYLRLRLADYRGGQPASPGAAACVVSTQRRRLTCCSAAGNGRRWRSRCGRVLRLAPNP